MQLERFWVGNYRSIKDSGWIDVTRRTVFVGRNESGKSNLLLALKTLRPHADGDRPCPTRDFPADVPRSEYRPDLDVVRTVWSLDPAERDALRERFPEARSVTHVEVGRPYEGECWVRFQGMSAVEPVPSPPAPDVAPFDAPTDDAPADLLEPFSPTDDVDVSGADGPGFDGLDGAKDAQEWVLAHLPSFVFLEDYPEIEGQQNLVDFLRRQKEGDRLPGDAHFENLLITAGLDPDGIDRLLTADPHTRRQLVNGAGRVVTRRLREMWSDRALKVRFDLDGEHFHTLVSDPNSIYDVEVNLNARSRGFRWFFSFYVTFAAAAKAGRSANTILLLDEPGLHLHPLGQRDLLDHLAEFENQVMLTTQSPFMVPSDSIGEVRTVSIAEEPGTTVSNAPYGDSKTLFPVSHVLAAEVARSLFDQEWSLVVEDVTDFWYLRAVSNFVGGRGGIALPSELGIFPAGGTAAVVHLANLLSSGPTRAIVLRREIPADPLSAQLAAPEHVVFVGEGLGDGTPGAHDLEDLIDAHGFDRLVRIAHKAQIEDHLIEPDEAVPGALERYTRAFAERGLVFSRSRVARVFLHAMAQNPDAVLPDATRQRFERLFRAIRDRMESPRR